jgi:hypothetical protein
MVITSISDVMRSFDSSFLMCFLPFDGANAMFASMDYWN